jgi:IclR family pca regulon transcriptional regulator
VRYLNILDVNGEPVKADLKPRDFVQSLERGLLVLRAFNARQPAMTLAEVARATKLTRATARRVLHTLVTLGYASTDGRLFELTPLVLDLGHAYVSSLRLPDIAEPFMEELSARVHESVSASVLDGAEIVYVARIPTKRIMAVSLSIGSRLPAAWTSMGRVLLAGLPDAELERIIASRRGPGPTERAITDHGALLAEIAVVRQQGFAIVDQELEEGVRSAAVGLHDRRGRVIAAINVGTHASRVTLKEMRTVILPNLTETARLIDARLAKR